MKPILRSAFASLEFVNDHLKQYILTVVQSHVAAVERNVLLMIRATGVVSISSSMNTERTDRSTHSQQLVVTSPQQHLANPNEIVFGAHQKCS
ncbi:unnamed protein product [Didymodactylos carnosus]|uniref:Uncharacterized protein n=1 Tax=Didymodactylos carnosus TaxID=1234261 RepID=A0A8S2HK93_9BILA|nr:unnamed protein product [Didymodactylos carnosus]CAF3651503.1 unnamed protein product [Didymodactylos carnosus]